MEGWEKATEGEIIKKKEQKGGERGVAGSTSLTMRKIKTRLKDDRWKREDTRITKAKIDEYKRDMKRETIDIIMEEEM